MATRRVDRRAFIRATGGAAALAAGAVLTPRVRGRGLPSSVAVDAPGDDAATGVHGDPVAGETIDPVAMAVAMIRFDTSHGGEGGVTRPHAEWLKARWEAVGVPTEIIPTPKPDNVHFIARIRSAAPAGAPPLLLLCHSDVVSVDRARWTVDPFAGVVENGFLYGRGAIDMKGANAAFMAALLRHLGEGARFDRDIIFVSDTDEEAGPYGGRWLASNHWDRVAAGAVLTEGGWVLLRTDGTTPLLAAVTVEDRAAAQVELATEAVTTHSARPTPTAAAVADPKVSIRLLPRRGLTEEETAASVEAARVAAPAPTDTDVFAAWAAAVAKTYPGAATAPCLFEAGTSGGPWRQRGIPVYGLYPYAVDNDTMTRMHGDDERVAVEALAAGTELMYRLFARFRL
jgi:acetylornithine deacetylase/succinyl-diaminopimelate desuccinylase-like protein